MSAVVAIVGRPNVGKSTLFNRLVGKRLALVDDTPGVTRDRRAGEARLGDMAFTVMDTAGLEESDAESLSGRMRQQTEAAIRDCDVVLFVVDARTGLTPSDHAFADLVRKSGQPVILVANKAEGKLGEAGVMESFSLGLGDPVPLSAEHGDGMADLHIALQPFVEPEAEEDEPAEGEEGAAAPTRPLKVAIVGRPNAGKSTLINQLIGEERMLTGPEAGITRDSISVDWAWRGRTIRLFDTAGMRRKARVEEKLEKLAVADALRAIRFADIVVVLLDATIPFEKQDLQIVDLIEREGRGLVIGLNKWDLVEDEKTAFEAMREAADRLLPQVRGVRLVRLSGLAGTGLDALMKGVIDADAAWNKRVTTSKLNRWLEGVLERHPPPAVSGRRVKIRYATQPKTRPPHFVVFTSRPDAVPDSYKRYLVNSLRETFALDGVPIRVTLRGGENPFHDKDAGRR